MQINIHLSPKVARKFPELHICIGEIHNLRNEKTNDQIRRLGNAVYAEVLAKYDIETLKDDKAVRAYRDFYWTLDVDPTKTRLQARPC